MMNTLLEHIVVGDQMNEYIYTCKVQIVCEFVEKGRG